MDKYEFNIKVEQIKKMVAKQDYETAMKIADTIDWRRVRNVNILSMVATIYEKNEEFQEAKDILLLAFERAPIGKRLLYKLAELAIRQNSIAEAEDYYREFCDLAPDDPRQYILRYLILGAKGAPVQQLIHTLEQYCNEELDEKWLYELAELYNEAGMGELCVLTCDKIMLMFGLGKYVDKAMELKIQYEPLTTQQMDLVENRDKYEARLKAVEREYESGRPGYGISREAAYTREPAEEEQDTSEAAEAKEQYAEPEADKEQPAASAEEPEEPAAREAVTTPPEEDSSWKAGTTPQEEADARLRFHEEEAQARLAQEMSKLTGEETVTREPEESQTKVLSDIRELSRLPRHTGASHLMIEAEAPEAGLQQAVEALRRIHQETGAKNQAAKISGEKLNRRGIFTISDKLTGKDLIIEQAGDMSEAILQELNQLLTRDETGMNVVLIDTPERMERLKKNYPGLAKWFEKPQDDGAQAARPSAAPQTGNTQAARPSAPSQAGSAQAARPSAAPQAGAPRSAQTETGADQESNAAARPQKEDNRPVRRVEPRRDNAMPPIAARKKKPVVNTRTEEPAQEQEQEMGIDEFAQYAQKYASDIDCSISGKSMLALYERIEIMQEDGIPLTKTSAEDLIEEAADKAENPALFKKLTGIFSSRYDKEGMLILKEEHFI